MRDVDWNRGGDQKRSGRGEKIEDERKGVTSLSPIFA